MKTRAKNKGNRDEAARHIGRRLAIGVAVASIGAPGVVRAETGDWLTVHGLVDIRAFVNDAQAGWLDRGLGKLRFGGDGTTGGDGHIDGALSVRAALGWDWTAVATITADDRSRNPVDLLEAYFAFKPVPRSDFSYSAKVGAFFPPVSMENTGLAWTSPYTLSFSAINTWVGEELRVYGGEATATYSLDDIDLSVTGALFAGNDPAGALLVWRGWSISDRKSGLFERLPLPRLRLLLPGGSAPQQAPWVEPTAELDNRIGVYGALAAKLFDGSELRLTLYDNRARDTAFDGFQYAWHTRFANLGARWFLTDDLEVLAQGMISHTSMGTKVPGQPLVAADFGSAFVLLAKSWGRSRLALRAEYFMARDTDRTADDINTEHGNALTLAYSFRPSNRQKLSLELLYVASGRPERQFQGFAPHAHETQLQAAYRLTF